MSLAAWKKKYYQIEACDCPEDEAVAHSLRKWRGLRPEVLAEHKLTLSTRSICYGKHTMRIDGDSCALCIHYAMNFRRRCDNCPLRKHLGGTCDSAGQPYSVWNEIVDPEPMIKALEAVKRKQKAERKKRQRKKSSK